MKAKIRDTEIYFDIEGSGLVVKGDRLLEKPVAFVIHGGPGADHTVSKPYFTQLTDIAQVVFYDHRGNGRSSGDDPKEWNLAQWGDDLHGLCDALGIERPIVIGSCRECCGNSLAA